MRRLACCQLITVSHTLFSSLEIMSCLLWWLNYMRKAFSHSVLHSRSIALLFFAFFLKSTFFLIVCPINMKPVGNPKSCRTIGSVLLCACECEVVQGRGSPLGTVHRFRQWQVFQSGFLHLCVPSFVFSSHWSRCFSLKLSWTNYISSISSDHVNIGGFLSMFVANMSLWWWCGRPGECFFKVHRGGIWGFSHLLYGARDQRKPSFWRSVAQGKTSLVGTFSFQEMQNTQWTQCTYKAWNSFCWCGSVHVRFMCSPHFLFTLQGLFSYLLNCMLIC